MGVTLPCPPKVMDFVGGGDFDAIGRMYLRYFIDFAGLKPHHRVLDVGCGIGRMARPLAEFLDVRGAYEGFDVVRIGIDWCQKNITPLCANVRFRTADVYNSVYNPCGAFDANEYVFPYKSQSFDYVFLTSVFTHMLPAGVENYLREISRVLKVDGTCLITYFLQNAETQRFAADGQGHFIFKHRRDGYWIAHPELADEQAICFDEDYVLDLYRRCGLKLEGPIRRGSWCGQYEYAHLQDIVVARKVQHVATGRVPGPITIAIRRWVRRWQRRLHAEPVVASASLHGIQNAQRQAA
jgi:SAM-dependent methyltransferase